MEKDELLKYIGNKIKEYRKQKKLNQADLAKEIGVTNTSVSEYERGNVNIDADTLFKIAKVLDVKVDDFFPKRQTDPRPSDLMEEFMPLDSRYVMRFQELFNKLSTMNEKERKIYLEELSFTLQLYELTKNKN